MAYNPNRTRYRDYENRRSWLIDTAETPQDRAETKREVSKLDKTMNWASRSARTSGGITGNNTGRVTKVYRMMGKK